MRNKVLLLNPPAETKFIRDFYCSFSAKANYYWPPQDLLALSAILSQKYKVEVLDAVSLNLDKDTCYKKIMKSPATVLVFTTGSASFDKDIKFIERVRNNKDIKIIGISSIFRFIGKEIMGKYPFLDVLLMDFTDENIISYLMGNYTSCDNMIYREGCDIHVFRKDKEGDFSIGISAHELFAHRSNRIPMFGDSPFAIVVSSIGCCFKCKFCVAGTLKLRKRILTEVIEELKYISNLGTKKVFFVDPIFTADKNRVFEFCENIRNGGIKIEWICNAHPATLQDQSLLEAMKKAGCKALLIGVESANDNILSMYNKSTDIGQIKLAFRLCQNSGIKTLAYFIIGLPGEDRKSIEKTIKFAKDIKCDYASFGYATADIGTELRKDALRNNWLIVNREDEAFDSSAKPVFRTSQLSEGEARELLSVAYRRFYIRPGYIIKRFLEVNSLGDLRILLKGGRLLLKKSAL